VGRREGGRDGAGGRGHGGWVVVCGGARQGGTGAWCRARGGERAAREGVGTSTSTTPAAERPTDRRLTAGSQLAPPHLDPTRRAACCPALPLHTAPRSTLPHRNPRPATVALSFSSSPPALITKCVSPRPSRPSAGPAIASEAPLTPTHLHRPAQHGLEAQLGPRHVQEASVPLSFASSETRSLTHSHRPAEPGIGAHSLAAHSSRLGPPRALELTHPSSRSSSSSWTRNSHRPHVRKVRRQVVRPLPLPPPSSRLSAPS